MSVELYPNHKAILHFHNSLKVFEIDFLDYLTSFLIQKDFEHRHFDIYVKPTLSHSAFDFIVVEPNCVYIFQTPEDLDQAIQASETYQYFIHQRLYSLSRSFHQRLRRTVKEKQEEKANQLIKHIFYFYEDRLIKEFSNEEFTEEKIITSHDFIQSTDQLMELFKEPPKDNFLTDSETNEIKQTLNPNTNIKKYVQKSIPKDYEGKSKSLAQTKQKFKGPENSGKTLLLTKRVINCVNRLKGDGRILVIAGDISKVNVLKDIITAEDGRSLQEIGVEVSSFQELAPPKEKYSALFVDDGHYLKPEWYQYLLDYYLVDMNKETNYEYVVMTDDENLPVVPKIHGRFRALKYDINHIHKMLHDSREIFLSILNN